jgi:asparagine synthetase B (glutamine-hydrolysing)
MCGKAGLVNRDDEELPTRMTDLQTHRGLDDRGAWHAEHFRGGWVGLGYGEGFKEYLDWAKEEAKRS